MPEAGAGEPHRSRWRSSLLPFGLGLLVVGAVMLALAAYALMRRSDRPARPAAGTGLARALAHPTPAVFPFSAAGLEEARISVGGRCLRVLVANDLAERVRGLRGVTDLGPYEGMIFVEPETGPGAFTMADTLVPLEIGFYDAAGRPVDRKRMVPCSGTDATCPRYVAAAAFRYAVETPVGGLPAGAVGACS